MTALNIAINKASTSIKVEFDDLPDHVQQFVVEYGLRQILNDCHSGEKDPELAMALVEKKLAAMMAGEIKAGRTSADPFSAWLKPKLVALIANQAGVTKKAATEELRKRGKTSDEWLASLFNADTMALADKKYRAEWEEEKRKQAELKSFTDGLDLNLV